MQQYSSVISTTLPVNVAMHSRVVMRRTSESADFVISHPNPKIRKNHIRRITSVDLRQLKISNCSLARQLKTNLWKFHFIAAVLPKS